MTALLLGIDSGQSACKAALFDLDGREIAVATTQNAVRSPHPRWVERDLDELWRQVCGAVRAVLALAAARLDGPVEVLGVGVCGHGDGTYLVDDAGRAVRPAVLATDSRAFREAARLGSGQTGRRALELTGLVPFAASPAAILAWLTSHEPQTLERARWALFCKDFIRLRLTGEIATDPSEASASFTDVHAQIWSVPALELYGLGELRRLLPPIRGCEEVAGTITAAAAQECGLAEGLPVVTGAHDVNAAALGIGAHSSGAASAVLGTFSINQIVADAPITDRRWQARSFVRAGRWMHMSTSPAGATNLDWAVRRIGPWTAAEQPDPAAAVAQAQEVAASPSRALAAPIFLPFLYGGPHGDDLAASWVGVRGWHERADLLYAVLEGVAFNHRTHLDALGEAFAMDRGLRVCGGGARSAAWTQVLADVVGLTVEVTDADEAGARGVAMLAGVGAGIFDDVLDAADRVVRVVRRQEPRAAEVVLHEQRYRRYRSVVDALAGVSSAEREG